MSTSPDAPGDPHPPLDRTAHAPHPAGDGIQEHGSGDAAGTLAPAAVRHTLEPLLSAAPGASTVVVGLHHAGGRELIARGRTAHHHGVPATPATRFEIGSLTKTFTALLLAEQAAAGALRLDDPLARHLPARTVLPAGGSALTLTHLATHTSGLPRLPPGLLRRAVPALFTNPYAAFTTDHVLAALARSRLHAPPGSRMRYSNFAVGLLGHALAGAAATPYPDLLQARVLVPLRLHDTGCDTEPPAGGTQVTGYWHRRSRPPFLIPGLQAAGALRASARDLLTFAEALLEPDSAAVPPTLRTALRTVRLPRHGLGRNGETALIWNVRTRPDSTRLYHHSGGTRGCTAFVGFSPRHRTALVALANTSTAAGTFVQAAYTTLVSVLP